MGDIRPRPGGPVGVRVRARFRLGSPAQPSATPDESVLWQIGRSSMRVLCSMRARDVVALMWRPRSARDRASLSQTRELQDNRVAGATGLEPATSGVTEQRSITGITCNYGFQSENGHRQVTVLVRESHRSADFLAPPSASARKASSSCSAARTYSPVACA